MPKTNEYKIYYKGATNEQLAEAYEREKLLGDLRTLEVVKEIENSGEELYPEVKEKVADIFWRAAWRLEHEVRVPVPQESLQIHYQIIKHSQFARIAEFALPSYLRFTPPPA